MHIKSENQLNNYIYIFFFISIWFCLDTNFYNILSFKEDNNIKNFFLSLRAIFPLIFFFCFLFYFNFKIEFLTNNKSLNFILLIYSLYFFFQLPGLLLTENSLINSYYAIISLIAIFSVAASYNKIFNKNTFYIISFIILTPVVFVYGYLSWEWIVKTHNINMYGTFPQVFVDVGSFSTNVIRSSGLARSTMILIIPLFFWLLIQPIKSLYLFFYLFLGSIIYLTQSRIVLLFYFSFLIFSFVYLMWNKSLKQKIIKIFVLGLLPILIVNLTLLVKEEMRAGFISKRLGIEYNKERSTKFFREYNEKFDFFLEGDTKFQDPENYIRNLDPKTFTSNRFGYWRSIIHKSNEPIFGYGVLGDRFLINFNAANTLVYSYASGGLISLILMIVILLRYTYLCIHSIFFRKIHLKKENIVLLSSIFTMSFLMLRGIAEVGIGVFSIDFLIFLSCLIVLEENLKKLDEKR
mgnify:FL=1